jgi:hypothetical protein
MSSIPGPGERGCSGLARACLLWDSPRSTVCFQWLIERLGFRTPGQARRDLAAAGCGAGPTCRRVG